MATYAPPLNDIDIFDTTNFTNFLIPIIPDNSLVVAQTDNLQTLLDGKMPLLFPSVYLGNKTAFTLTSNYLNMMVSWTAQTAFTITIPTAVGKTNGTWLGLSSVSSTSTQRNQNVTPTGQTTLGAFIAEGSPRPAGNGVIIVCIDELWKRFTN